MMNYKTSVSTTKDSVVYIFNVENQRTITEIFSLFFNRGISPSRNCSIGHCIYENTGCVLNKGMPIHSYLWESLLIEVNTTFIVTILFFPFQMTHYIYDDNRFNIVLQNKNGKSVYGLIYLNYNLFNSLFFLVQYYHDRLFISSTSVITYQKDPIKTELNDKKCDLMTLIELDTKRISSIQITENIKNVSFHPSIKQGLIKTESKLYHLVYFDDVHPHLSPILTVSLPTELKMCWIPWKTNSFIYVWVDDCITVVELDLSGYILDKIRLMDVCNLEDIKINFEQALLLCEIKGNVINWIQNTLNGWKICSNKPNAIPKLQHKLNDEITVDLDISLLQKSQKKKEKNRGCKKSVHLIEDTETQFLVDKQKIEEYEQLLSNNLIVI